MSIENYQASLKKVLVHEGGYVNHPADPGGETNFGITFRVYDAYRMRKNLPRQSVRNISQAEVEEIYRIQYWDKIRGNELPRGVDYVVFDGAVNSGPAQSIKWLQAALGCKVDGNLGEATMFAIEQTHDYKRLIREICARRMAFLRNLRTWGTFGKGWSNRVSGVQAVGQSMVSGGAARVALLPEAAGTEEKAMPDQVAQPDTAENIRDGGLGLGAVTEVANQLMPFQEYSNIIRYVVAGLIIIGVCAALYAIWKKRKIRQVEMGTAMAEVKEPEEA